MRNSFIALLLLLAFPAYALTIDAPLPDAAQEQRAKALFHDIRCMVCASEAVADSPAEVARDVRRVVREQIASGMSDDEIKRYLVSQFGQGILFQPSMSARNLPLWLGPFALLIIGGFFAWRHVFARKP